MIFDSKGFALRNQCPGYDFPFQLWCLPGGRTKDLVDLLENRIEKAVKRHSNIIIYFWSGTCDITIKKGKYIYLRSENSKIVQHITEEYYRAIDIVKNYGFKVVLKFVECPTLSIYRCNFVKGKSNYNRYIKQDKTATKQIEQLNSRIREINSNILNANTLAVSKYLVKRRKKRGKKKPRYSVNLNVNQPDGIHPGRQLSLAWTKYFLKDPYKECYVQYDKQEIVDIHISV